MATLAQIEAPPRAEADVQQVLQNPRTYLFIGLVATLAALVVAVRQPWTVPFVVGASASTLLLWFGAYFDVYMCLE